MAAEVLSAAGVSVTLHDRMPSVGRKLLMAGRGGLNLTHSEYLGSFLARYGAQADRMRPILEAYPPAALIAWAEGLGQETFTGSSGRVFPKALKASPLLRAWLARLAAQGVELRPRSEWLGWDETGALRFRTASGEIETARADTTVLALGGASWPKLGSNGAWAELLSREGVEVAPLLPANVGFDVAWSEIFRDRFQGAPLKNVGLRFEDQAVRGEAMVTRQGLEGGAVYALSAQLREAVATAGSALVEFDLRPDQSIGQLTDRLQAPRAGQTATNYLRKTMHLSPAEIGLLREAHGVDLPTAPGAMARRIKAVPIRLTGIQPIARAISTAGGVAFTALDENLMLRGRPGVFVAGEMLDWEAPTGGYLLQASFASGVAAARGALATTAA
jgi:uncharacterized flavoprotein (TIGR03862 family)